jgi:hypothetical protein
MAMREIEPIEARVHWDRRAGRPSKIRFGARQVEVRALEAVRDETAAWPASHGPRITYLLTTTGGQASLVFDGRRRRWYVAALDAAA